MTTYNAARVPMKLAPRRANPRAVDKGTGERFLTIRVITQR